MTTRRRPTIGAPSAPPTAAGEACQPAGDRQVELVRQGGGAPGAYPAGVYEGLHEAGIEPDCGDREQAALRDSTTDAHV